MTPSNAQLSAIKSALFIACLAPAFLLWRGLELDTLGANPIEAITRSLGEWTLRLLLITLAVTPVRKLTGWHWIVRLRRTLGLFAFAYGVGHLLTYVWLDQFFDWEAIVKDILKRPFITVGFAALVLMTASKAAELGLKPLARIAGYAKSGVDHKIMGTGPIPAVRKLMQKTGWTLDQLDLIEANEAFAAQAISVNRDLGWDLAKVNVNGGAIAIGHPIGCSGARILTDLVYEMGRRDAKKGVATLCIGGGMGVALAIERD